MKIIVDALRPHPEDGFVLHPDLQAQQETLQRHYHARWFIAPAGDALTWYSWLGDAPLLPLLAASLQPQPGECQAWLVSPYHAQLRRDAFHLSSYHDFTWREEDAVALANLLNPVLAEEGMRLANEGAILCLFTRQSMQAEMPTLAEISANGLPRRTPAGDDGMRLMRWMAEIQTQLFQHPLPGRQGMLPVSGVWLWAAASVPFADVPPPLPIHSQHPLLPSCAQARIHICSAEEQAEPGNTLLLASASEPCAVLLQRRSPLARWRSWARRSSPFWHPTKPADSSTLRQHILAYA